MTIQNVYREVDSVGTPLIPIPPSTYCLQLNYTDYNVKLVICNFVRNISQDTDSTLLIVAK